MSADIERLTGEVAKLSGIMEGWEIPKFKSEVFGRLNDVEQKVVALDGGRMSNIETRVRVVEDTETQRKGMWKIIAVVAGIASGIAGILYLAVDLLLRR